MLWGRFEYLAEREVSTNDQEIVVHRKNAPDLHARFEQIRALHADREQLPGRAEWMLLIAGMLAEIMSTFHFARHGLAVLYGIPVACLVFAALIFLRRPYRIRAFLSDGSSIPIADMGRREAAEFLAAMSARLPHAELNTTAHRLGAPEDET